MIAYKISRNAKVLFVGINPHPGSYRRGMPFSNNKMFWYLLNRAGLLGEGQRDLKSDESLKQFYENEFLQKYALNFVNLVDRPTINVTELEKDEERVGVKRAVETITAQKPKVVCFIGKITLNAREVRAERLPGNGSKKMKTKGATDDKNQTRVRAANKIGWTALSR
jgi:TDG/mug DNA glycosylase family protein